jgi:hypothetical protein
MISYVEVNDSSIVRKEDKHVEQLEGDGWNNEEVQNERRDLIISVFCPVQYHRTK